MTSPFSHLLRPEAQPVDWSRLDLSQKTAFRRVVALLSENQHRLESERELPKHAWLRNRRHSAVGFLNGARGSGKSTLLNTLVYSMSDSEWGTELQDNELRNALDGLRSKIVWLEPIDMEPYPEPLNLIAAILVRIRESLWPVDPRAGNTVGLAATQADDGLLKFDRFLHRVAPAWDSNLSSRRAALTGEQYSLEVVDLEAARLNFNRDFREAVEAATKHLRQIDPTRPEHLQFVLPIDDFDLNPGLCLTILRLLRMVSVPSVFTLVLGAWENIDMVLRLSSTNELFKNFSALSVGDPLPVQESDYTHLADRIANNAARKLVPPSQRVHIRPIQINDALEFKASPTDPQTREVLSKIPFDTHPYSQASNLMELFCLGEDFSNSKMDESTFYSGTHILRGPYRNLIDLYILLLQYRKQRKSASDNDLLALAESLRSELMTWRVAETGTDLERKKVREWLGSAGQGRFIRNFQVTLQDEPSDVIPITESSQMGIRKTGAGPQVLSAKNSRELSAQKTAKTLFVRKSVDVATQVGMPGSSLKLKSNLNGGLILLHDLLAHYRAASSPPFQAVWNSEQLGTSPGEEPDELATVDFNRLSWVYCDWKTGDPETPARYYWPAPDFLKLWSFDRFRMLWNHRLPSILTEPESGSEERTGTLLRTWINVATDALVPYGFADQEISSSRRNGKEHWHGLFRKLDTLIGAKMHRSCKHELQKWLLKIPMLLFEGTGLTDDEFPSLATFCKPQVNDFKLEYPRLSDHWRQNCRTVRTHLARRIGVWGRRLDRQELLKRMPHEASEFGFFVAEKTVEKLATKDFLGDVELEAEEAIEKRRSQQTAQKTRAAKSKGKKTSTSRSGRSDKKKRKFE